MPIYYDNFESYGTITTTPFGSFTGGGAAIVSTNYVTTGSRAISVNGNESAPPLAIYYDSNLYSSTTMWCAFQLHGLGTGPLIRYENGVSFPTNVFEIKPESDLTLSVVADGAFGANSGNFVAHLDTWYFAQVNTTVINDGGLVATIFNVGIEGTSVMSGTVTSTISTTSTPSGTAQWDHLKLTNNAYFDEFTLDTQTSMGIYPNPGTPKARASTGLVELVKLQQDANIRASTGLIELIISQHGWEVHES